MLSPYPYEAVIVAALELAKSIVDLTKSNREGMDPEVRKRFDLIHVAALERLERIVAMAEKALMLREDNK